MCEAEKFLLICEGEDCDFQEEIHLGEKVETRFEKENSCPKCGCCSFKVRELLGGALV